MNAYSVLIQKYLDHNFPDMIPQEKYNNNIIIKKLTNIFDTTPKTLSIKHQGYDTLHKLHSYDDLILPYIVIRQLYNDNIIKKHHKFVPDLNNYVLFINWYKSNQHNINIRELLEGHKSKKYDEYRQLLFAAPIPRNKLHELIYDNSFVSLDVIQHAESEDLECDKYEGHNFVMWLFRPGIGAVKPDIKLIDHIINFVQKLANSKIKVNLIVFYGNQKKYLTTEGLITPENMNSGSTFPGNVIMIWRKEEFFKVLIHELVHYYGLDFNNHPHVLAKMSEHRDKVLRINCSDYVNETYTELLGLTLHSVIFAHIHKISFDYILNYELFFTLFQIAKMIKFFGGDTVDSLYEITLNQTTSMCSYIICKGMFLANYHDLLHLWNTDGLNVGKKLCDDYVELYRMIVSKNALKKYEKVVNYMIGHMKLDDGSFMSRTMRMTMFQ